MKTFLQIYSVLFTLVLFPFVGMAQAINEPGINSTLDSPDITIVKDQELFFDLFVDARDRKGEVMAIRIKLDNPAQRQNITMQYTIDPDRNNPTNAVFTPLTFNEEGIGYIGTEAGTPLKDYYIVLKAKFTEVGRYGYKLQLERDDDNIMANTAELIRVTSTTGTDDMIENSRIMAYPTIAKDVLNVELGQVRNANVVVADMLGRTVYTASNMNGTVAIDTRQMGKGLYFVKVVKDGDAAALRFIVQ
ncbi:T9SS type A sorting domain-containing protein [Pontibacter sp. H259]|uniref:T9SS type A sorting domain-containing protein n=1 Tax=Pontibacter sp. H259 TaxID=3133421 RepID=UPI0030BCCDEC